MVCSLEMTYHCSHGIQEAHVLDSRRPFQFALRVYVQETEKTIFLSAENEDELRTWKDLPIQLRVR